MSATDQLYRSSRCFCQIPFDELEKWFNKHYQQGIPTLELLALAANAHEREVISIVAIFELDDASVLQLMGNVNLPEHHILHCREHFREKLQQCRDKNIRDRASREA